MADSRESLWAKSIPALIGLVGVLVGAVITSGIAYLGDRNRRHGDKQAAIRLVAAEIRSDEISLAKVIEDGRAPIPPSSRQLGINNKGCLRGPWGRANGTTSPVSIRC